MKAIDVHAHYGDPDDGSRSLTNQVMAGDIEVVRRRAQAAGVVLSVVSPIRALGPYKGDVRRGNDEAAQVCEKYDGVRFWAVLDPLRKETYRQVESLLSHPLCAGIKLHPIQHQYEISQQGDAIFEFADHHKTVVLTHSGDPGSYPEDFVPFANRYTAMRLILAHLGNSDFTRGALSRHVHAIRFAQAGNLYVDTSSVRSVASGLIEWTVQQIPVDRILFGTDTPVYFTASQKARIEFAEIDDAAKRAILFDNAARLLGVPGIG